MKYPWFTLLLPLLIVGTSAAQRPLITPDTHVNSATLLGWFRSGDPLLVAWAADFARRTNDKTLIQEMTTWLQQQPIPSLENESQQAERRAIIAVLDALIQENVQVPISAIKAVAESFPAQAVIMIHRLPLDDSRATLNEWTYVPQGNPSERTLARIATMMLAKDPTSMRAHESSLASRITAASEEDMSVSVSAIDTEAKPGGVIHFLCAPDSFESHIAPGWPQIYTYDLVENTIDARATSLLDFDNDRIAYRRFERIVPGGCSSPVQELDSRARHGLLAYWLGIQEDHMIWRPAENFSIVWSNNQAYQQQLGELVETQRDKLQAMVETLHSRGILTYGQMTTSMPKLIVTIRCDIQPCPLD